MRPRFPSLRALLPCLAAVWLLGFGGIARAQTPLHVRGQVRDAEGRPAAGASVVANGAGGEVKVVADGDGRFELEYMGALTLRATARAMESDAVQVSAAMAATERLPWCCVLRR